jgi:hypothetical protein
MDPPWVAPNSRRLGANGDFGRFLRDLGGLNIGATLDFTGFDDDDFTTNDALGLSALYNPFNNLSGDISIKLRAFSMISSMSISSIFGNSGIFSS